VKSERFIPQLALSLKVLVFIKQTLQNQLQYQRLRQRLRQHQHRKLIN
jgi:hypothetical protein